MAAHCVSLRIISLENRFALVFATLRDIARRPGDGKPLQIAVDRVPGTMRAGPLDVPLSPAAAQKQTCREVRDGPMCGHLVAIRWVDRLIYLKIASETRAQLTFGRPRYVQTIGR